MWVSSHAERQQGLGPESCVNVPILGTQSMAARSPLATYRVLIADGDEPLLAYYRERLGCHGFLVITATSGVECVEKLRRCAPDVLVLEPSLPWGGGDGVLAMMHEAPDVPLVPVVVLTYGRDPGALYRLAPFGAADYQVKPLSAERLAERIRLLTPASMPKGADTIFTGTK